MSKHERETGPNVLPVFTVMDLDRTIFKTTAFTNSYLHPHLLAYYDGPTQKIVAPIIDKLAQHEQDSRGQSFDFLQVLTSEMQGRGLLAPDAIEITRQILAANTTDDGRIKDSFIEDVLDVDIFKLATLLDDEGGWGIVTKGGRDAQSMKLAIVRAIFEDRNMRAPGALIVQSDKKTDQVLTLWYEDNDFSASYGMFTIPLALVEDEAVAASRLRIVDDKPENLRIVSEFEAADKIETVCARRLEDGEGEGLTLADLIARLETSS